jgi:NADH-quinone oxidoreductase subunit F
MKAAFDLSEVDAMVAEIGREAEDLIPLLQAIQKRFHWLPPEALERLCEITEIKPTAITGVSTFYAQFRHRPVGRHLVKTCVGTACHVTGSGVLDEALRKHLKIPADDDTDANGDFTIGTVACLGCCMLAPVVQIDDVIYGHVEASGVPELIRDVLATDAIHQQDGEDSPALANAAGEARICLCSSCVAGGSRDVYFELKKQASELALPVSVREVACTGHSFQTPLIEIALQDQNHFRYGLVKPEDVRAILLKHFTPTTWLRRAGASVCQILERIFTEEEPVAPVRFSKDVRFKLDPFSAKQKRIVTEHAGELRPEDIDDYIAHDGFKALKACLAEKTPDQIIEEIKASGLRGRGGAGFPTGQKWAVTRASADPEKYIICNGDEGDPGAFMDRMVLESFPFRVLEGMVIAARAISAREGFLYIRAEYPLATRRIREAIKVCERRGFLGENILDTEMSLKLRVVEGAGAFVCGEETALIAAIEGGRGMPRFRPPFPAQSGVWGKPTLINNVETFASVPWIFRNGAANFAAIGTGKSKGAKTFALAGKIVRGGLIEVPMGMTLREIVHEIGGGIPNGRKFKAALMGGPSGGCVPARLEHTPVDFEELRGVGAIMGSGGMVILDETDCMVDIARYFMTFCQDESCGKCTHCRIGTMRMKEILDRLCTGNGRKGDIEKLETLAATTVQGSLCGLGKTAPNPVLSSLKYFRDEFEAHIRGECPGKKCAALIRYQVTEECFGCTRCAQHCPVDAIRMHPYHRHEIDSTLCIRCDICRKVCPVDAIEVVGK